MEGKALKEEGFKTRVESATRNASNWFKIRPNECSWHA